MAEDFAQSALTAGMRYRDVLQSHPAARSRIIRPRGAASNGVWITILRKRKGNSVRRVIHPFQASSRAVQRFIQRFIQRGWSYHWMLLAGFSTQ
jgi:hypothetical protein